MGRRHRPRAEAEWHVRAPMCSWFDLAVLQVELTEHVDVGICQNSLPPSPPPSSTAQASREVLLSGNTLPPGIVSWGRACLDITRKCKPSPKSTQVLKIPAITTGVLFRPNPID